METKLPAGMAMRYAAKPNDRDTPDHPRCCEAERTIVCKIDDLITPKIPPEPLEQGGTGGIFAVIQLQCLAGEIKLACSQSES